METQGLLEMLKAMTPEYKKKLMANMKEYNHLQDHALRMKWMVKNPANGDYEIMVDNQTTQRIKAINKETPFGGVVHKDKF